MSRETGCFQVRNTFSVSSTLIPATSASSSGVASRPVRWRICSAFPFSVEMFWNMCTGMRIVRAWSATLRVIACRIHQVA